MIVHTHMMATEKRNPLGPTGETVRANIQRLREDQNLGYSKLARILEEIHRPIPELGLRRIEAGDRRVDVDDLMALAAALTVSPATLLMPDSVGPMDRVEATGVADHVAMTLWEWLTAEHALFRLSPLLFAERSWPSWVREKWIAQLPARARTALSERVGGEEVSSGDD